MMTDTEQLKQELGWSTLESVSLKRSWSGEFLERLTASLQRLQGHGRYDVWREQLQKLPRVASPRVELNADAPLCLYPAANSEALVCEILRALGPWKKGPFRIQDIHIDAEWRSNLKWDRVQKMAQPFAGRRVLDVGTGNGYFLYRAKGEGAKSVIGLEPSAHYCLQYLALQRFYQVADIAMLPLTSDQFEQGGQRFDTVLSMGVLYHRRSPLDHLAELKGFLRSRGELILETIVVDGALGYSLVPDERYAQMRNVWFLPSVDTLLSWLRRLGFIDLNVSESVTTTPFEQRSTSWTEQPSLKDFLNPNDTSLTVEGYSAPKRVIVSAIAP